MTKVWRHQKTEGVYYEIGRSSFEGLNVVIYAAKHDHSVWVRDTQLFDDGRFEFLGLTESILNLPYPLRASFEADLRPLLINEALEIIELQAA